MAGLTKAAQALTAKGIEAMKPDRSGAYRVPDTRCKGLALRVAASGKTWGLSPSGSKAQASDAYPWAAMRTLASKPHAGARMK
jgi:hypothetical protein